MEQNGKSGTMTRTRELHDGVTCIRNDNASAAGSQKCHVPCRTIILYGVGCAIVVIQMRRRGVCSGNVFGHC